MGEEKIIKTRRRYQRVIFSLDDGIICVFKPLLNSKKLDVKTASVMNLSAGGIQFTVRKEDANAFRIGDRLIFSGLRGSQNMDFGKAIEMEILWILELKFLENIGIGCEFKNMPESLINRIDQFVISEIKFRGQNIHRIKI